MKLAKALWSIGSLLVNVTIIIYIRLSGEAPLDPKAKFSYINENWHIYSTHWKVEFLLMTLVAIGALYFAMYSKRISWIIIFLGQMILLMTYPFMLGGYRNTPYELAELANQMAIVVFVFGNLIFFSGLFLLYLKDQLLKKWLKYTALVFTGIIVILWTITFADIISWKEAMVIGPLVNLLYILNAYYGLKIKL
jgi:hypothetical protein